MVTVFANPNYLSKGFLPTLDEILHRDVEKDKINKHFSCAMNGYVPNNLAVYGKSGIGKTLIMKLLTKELEDQAGRKAIQLKVYMLNCDAYSSSTKLIRALNFLMLNDLGIPEKKCMNNFSDYYIIFKQMLKTFNGILIIVLDEIDKLSNPDIINIFSRIVENGDADKNICIVGITNNVGFYTRLDSRIKSVLNQREIAFQPYNADHIRDILVQRSKYAFNPGTLEDDVIPLCAAYAAQESGDVRRAIDMLKVSGELADDKGDDVVNGSHVTEAKRKIEFGITEEVLVGLPRQARLVLAACAYEYLTNKPNSIASSDVYSSYKLISTLLGYEIFTQRRMTDLLKELDVLGFIRVKILSKGRFGRSKDITLNLKAEYLWNLMIRTDNLLALANIDIKCKQKKI